MSAKNGVQGLMQGYDPENPPDNVRRKEQFLLAHPNVTIRYHGKPNWYWVAEWEDAKGSTHRRQHGELKDLMDQLEAEFDE